MIGFYAAGAMGGSAPPAGFSVLSVTPAIQATPATSFNFTLPATINSGDLLILMVCARRDSSTTSMTTPTGWTQFYYNNAGSIRMQFLYRYAGSGEGGGTVSLSSGSDASFAAQCWRIAGASGAPQVAVTASGGWGTAPNPPTLASGLTGEIIWLSGAAVTPDLGVVSWSDTFTDNPTVTPVSGDIPQTLLASSLKNTTATMNPDTITTTVGAFGRAFTIAVGS